jgi:hypothetical protein
MRKRRFSPGNTATRLRQTVICSRQTVTHPRRAVTSPRHAVTSPRHAGMRSRQSVRGSRRGGMRSGHAENTWRLADRRSRAAGSGLGLRVGPGLFIRSKRRLQRPNALQEAKGSCLALRGRPPPAYPRGRIASTLVRVDRLESFTASEPSRHVDASSAARCRPRVLVPSRDGQATRSTTPTQHRASTTNHPLAPRPLVGRRRPAA